MIRDPLEHCDSCVQGVYLKQMVSRQNLCDAESLGKRSGETVTNARNDKEDKILGAHRSARPAFMVWKRSGKVPRQKYLICSPYVLLPIRPRFATQKVQFLPMCSRSGELRQPLTAILFESIAMQLPFLSMFWHIYAPLLVGSSIYTIHVYDMHLPFISQCFCRSIGVRGRWNTPT